MDKKFLKENNLYEAHKQFMRLCEMSILPEDLSEDENQDQDPNADPSMGGDMPPMGDDPNAMGGGDPSMGDPSMGGDSNAMDDGSMGGDPNAMDDDSMGGDPNAMDDGSMGGDMPPMGDDAMGEEDDVIDVDDITDAQEKMNDKINIVGKDLGKTDDKIAQLMSALDSMEQLINKNNAEIAAFKQEFEKRNPTQTEKLNMRSLDSYPFNVNPSDYWKAKGIDSNYEIRSDNNEPTNSEEELTITNSDVDEFDDKVVEDSFDIEDDMRQTIEKIFGI